MEREGRDPEETIDPNPILVMGLPTLNYEYLDESLLPLLSVTYLRKEKVRGSSEKPLDKVFVVSDIPTVGAIVGREQGKGQRVWTRNPSEGFA